MSSRNWNPSMRRSYHITFDDNDTMIISANGYRTDGDKAIFTRESHIPGNQDQTIVIEPLW